MVITVAAAGSTLAMPGILKLCETVGKQSSAFLISGGRKTKFSVSFVHRFQVTLLYQFVKGRFYGRLVSIEERLQSAGIKDIAKSFTLKPIANLQHFLAIDQLVKCTCLRCFSFRHTHQEVTN